MVPRYSCLFFFCWIFGASAASRLGRTWQDFASSGRGPFNLINSKRWMIGYLNRWRTQGVAECSTTCRSSRIASFLNVYYAFRLRRKQVYFKVLNAVIWLGCHLWHCCISVCDAFAAALYRVSVHAPLCREKQSFLQHPALELYQSIPAELKHIIKRRKRNKHGFP